MVSAHLSLVAGAILLVGVFDFITLNDLNLGIEKSSIVDAIVKKIQAMTESELSLTIIPEKRSIINLLSQADCDVLVRMIERQAVHQSVGDELYGLNIFDVNNKNFTLEERQLVVKARAEILRVTRAHFNNPAIYPEYTHITLRKPGLHTYSHGVHCDQCRINLKTLDCEVRADSCCGWRDYTAILYLNDPDGGDFLFHDYSKEDVLKGLVPTPNITRIHPTPGKLVFFSSGPENLHAVEPIKSGHRHAFALWMTMDKAHEERLPQGFLEDKGE